MKSKIKTLSLFLLLTSFLTLVASCTVNINTSEPAKCTITYDINMEGQTSPSPKEVLLGTKLSSEDILKEPVAIEGYNFLGWYIGNDKADGNYEVKTNITLTAKWENTTLSITYVLYDNNKKVVNYSKDNEVTLIIPEVRDGYVFTGWYESSDYKGNKITTLPKGTIGDKTYYAKWEKYKTVEEAKTYLASLAKGDFTYDLYVQVDNETDVTTLRDALQVFNPPEGDQNKPSFFINLYLKPGKELKTIPQYGLNKALCLKKVELLNGFIDIKDESFMNNFNLEEIILPSSLKNLGNNVFCYSSKLTSLTIPKHVEKIGFLDEIKTINYEGTSNEFLNIDYSLENKLQQQTIKCSDGTFDNLRLVDKALKSITPLKINDDYKFYNIPTTIYGYTFNITCGPELVVYNNNSIISKRLSDNNPKKSCYELTSDENKLSSKVEVIINHVGTSEEAISNFLILYPNKAFGPIHSPLILKNLNDHENFEINSIKIDTNKKIISIPLDSNRNFLYNYTVNDNFKFTLVPNLDDGLIHDLDWYPKLSNNDDKSFDLYINKDFSENSTISTIEIYTTDTSTEKFIYERKMR